MAYFNCAGLRVPAAWTVEELQRALKARHTKLQYDGQVIEDFLLQKEALEKQRQKLEAQAKRPQFKIGV
jgi:hypothetical protein